MSTDAIKNMKQMNVPIPPTIDIVRENGERKSFAIASGFLFLSAMAALMLSSWLRTMIVGSATSPIIHTYHRSRMNFMILPPLFLLL